MAATDKLTIAVKIAHLLAVHQDHMLQFKPEELIDNFINTGDAVVILDSQTNQLIGFAKNFLWDATNDKDQHVYEFGSWIVQPEYCDNGYGHMLAVTAVMTVKKKDPDAQVIAVCASDNPKPIGILCELGAFECPKPSNVQILLGAGETPVTMLDVSNINYK